MIARVLPLVFAAVLLHARAAEACSGGGGCSVRFLADDAVVPLNTQALAFDWSEPAGASGARVTVTDPSGNKIVDGVLLGVPGQVPIGGKLVEGARYQVLVAPRVTNVQCPEQTRSFRVGEAKTPPTRTGTADARYSLTKGGARTAASFGGPVLSTVGNEPFVSTADITIVPDDALAPYMPLVQFETFVDGEPWAKSPRGNGAKRSDGDSDVTTLHDFTRVYAWCPNLQPDADTSSSKCFVRGTQPGRHEVEIRANIPGVETPIEPIRLTVDLTCASNTATSATQSDSKDSGCSVGTRTSPATCALPVAAVALVLWRRRRRPMRAPR